MGVLDYTMEELSKEQPTIEEIVRSINNTNGYKVYELNSLELNKDTYIHQLLIKQDDYKPISNQLKFDFNNNCYVSNSYKYSKDE